MSTHADRVRMRLSRLFRDIPQPSPIDVHREIYERVSDARAYFLRGFSEALKVPPEALPKLLQVTSFQGRGFAIEGAAMALTLMDELSPVPHSRLCVLFDGRDAEEQTLGAIGVGWASARLGKPLDWAPTVLGSHYTSTVVDGYGFHQGFFHPYRFTGRGFPMNAGELSTFYDIGLGRALWFVHIGRVEPIVHTIDGFLPDRRKQLWRGVGTACAFNWCRDDCSGLGDDSGWFRVGKRRHSPSWNNSGNNRWPYYDPYRAYYPHCCGGGLDISDGA